MALITCPECGKSISDKAPACIHCGYPLQPQPIASDAPATSYKVVIPTYHGAADAKISAIHLVMDITGLYLYEARELVEQPGDSVVVKDGLSQNQADDIASRFKEVGVDAKIIPSSAPVIYISPSKDKDIVCCPKCGSIEYHAGARGYSLLTGFVGSGKTVLTCLKCGYRWKPGKKF